MLTVENSRMSRCGLACLRQRHENTHSDDLTQSAPGAHCLRAPSSAATFLKNTFFCLVQSPRPPRERQAALDGPLPIPLAQRPSDISVGDSHMRRTLLTAASFMLARRPSARRNKRTPEPPTSMLSEDQRAETKQSYTFNIKSSVPWMEYLRLQLLTPYPAPHLNVGIQDNRRTRPQAQH